MVPPQTFARHVPHMFDTASGVAAFKTSFDQAIEKSSAVQGARRNADGDLPVMC